MSEFSLIEPTPFPTPLEEGGWKVIHARARIDAFSHDELIKEFRSLLENGQKRIALDLKNNRFFSFNAIRFCSDTAREMSVEGGALVLIACPEKTKRHFEIYGSLDHIRIIRTELEL